MLLRLAPDALGRLGGRLDPHHDRQRDQRQDDDRGDDRRRARGRRAPPGPQPGRVEHDLGRRHGAARAARRGGAVRGRRGLAAQGRRPARPDAAGARQPLPRPARPLRRDGDAGRRLGRRSSPRGPVAPASRSTPTTRRSPTSAATRAARRARASSTSASRMPRRRCPSCSTPSTPSTAGAAAIPTPTSAPSSATSATTRARTAAPARPRPDVAATAIELRGMSGSRGDPAHAAGRDASCSSRCPASTTSTTPSPRSPLRSSSAFAPADDRQRLGDHAGRLRPGRDDRGRRHPALDPADQEPGRRQRGPAHAAAGGGPRRSSTSGSALNDRIADGRDVSWIWDADFELLAGGCGESPAPARARRRSPCGSSTPAGREDAIEVVPEVEGSLDRAAGRGPGAASSPCPPTPPCSSCASCSPPAATPRISGDERAGLARSRVRWLHRRPAALGGAGRRDRQADHGARLRRRPGDAAPRRQAGPARDRPRPQPRAGRSGLGKGTRDLRRCRARGRARL